MSCDSGKLRDFKKRQQRWMREREVETEVQIVRAERGRSQEDCYADSMPARDNALRQIPHKTRASAGPQHSAEDLINTVTGRMLERMRSELQSEIEKEQRSRMRLMPEEEHAKLEGFLAKEIESHTCPICYEWMLPPDHSPMLLFPCGHTFCSSCLFRHMEVNCKQACPICRVTIASKMSGPDASASEVGAMSSPSPAASTPALMSLPDLQAPNVSLQQLTQTYAAQRTRIRQGMPISQPDRGSDVTNRDAATVQVAEREESRIERELTSNAMRLSVVRNELDDALTKQRRLALQLTTDQRLLDDMRARETSIISRLDQLKAELSVLRDQKIAQGQKVQDLKDASNATDAQVQLLSSTLTPLEAAVERLTLLSEGVKELQGTRH